MRSKHRYSVVCDPCTGTSLYAMPAEVHSVRGPETYNSHCGYNRGTIWYVVSTWVQELLPVSYVVTQVEDGMWSHQGYNIVCGLDLGTISSVR